MNKPKIGTVQVVSTGVLYPQRVKKASPHPSSHCVSINTTRLSLSVCVFSLCCLSPHSWKHTQSEEQLRQTDRVLDVFACFEWQSLFSSLSHRAEPTHSRLVGQ